jgi:response regulator RpfG family c-di-GMP phosphodiesterase
MSTRAQKAGGMNLTEIFSREINRLPLTIKTKVILSYLILGIILIVGSAFIVNRIIFDTLEERFTNQLLEADMLASDRLVVEEEQMLEVLRLLTHSEGVPQALKNADPQNLRELTIDNMIHNRQPAVVFLDMEGNLVLSEFHVKGGNIDEYEFGSGGLSDLKNQPFVSSLLSGQTDITGNNSAGFTQTSQGQYLFISSPVYENDQQVGLVLLGKPLEDLVQQIRAETLAQITLYDNEGHILASTFSSPLPLGVDEVSRILENQHNTTFMETNSRTLNVRNFGYREIFSTWKDRNGQELGVLGIALGESFLVSTSRVTRLQIIFLAALVFILVVLIGMNLSNIITSPIRDLVNASNKVMQGNYNVTVTPTSKDELAMMANSFNKMIRSVNESRIQILESYDITIEGWSRALDLRSEETKGHTDRVTDLMDKMSVAMGIEGQRLTNIRRGTLLHDIGKMGIPDRILNKPGKLTDEEWKIMRFHPTYAYELLKDIHFLRPSLTIPLCHHERWDGSGYPRGLKGEEIPIEARMFALVDVWDAITNDRVYRNAMGYEEAIETIKKGMGNHFDPEVTEVFLKVVS